MKKLFWVIGLWCLIAVSPLLYLQLTRQAKVLADVTSPSGVWRVVVRGKDVWGGVEVTAVVHTRDEREISVGVIDLRPERNETEHFYQADPIFHTRIDEVKAVVGDRLLLRDTYFPNEYHAITGEISGQSVELRIGKVNNLGFHFASTDSLNPAPAVSVRFLDFSQRLFAGAVFEVETASKKIIPPNVTCNWRDPETGHFMIASLYQNYSLREDEEDWQMIEFQMKTIGVHVARDAEGKWRRVNSEEESKQRAD